MCWQSTNGNGEYQKRLYEILENENYELSSKGKFEQKFSDTLESLNYLKNNI